MLVNVCCLNSVESFAVIWHEHGVIHLVMRNFNPEQVVFQVALSNALLDNIYIYSSYTYNIVNNSNK